MGQPSWASRRTRESSDRPTGDGAHRWDGLRTEPCATSAPAPATRDIRRAVSGGEGPVVPLVHRSRDVFRHRGIDPAIRAGSVTRRSVEARERSANLRLSPGGSFPEKASEARRCHGAVGVLAQHLHRSPVDAAVEPHPDPAATSDIRRAEEPLRIGFDQGFLDTRPCCAPQMWEFVVVVALGPQVQELLSGEERRRAVAALLDDAGQSQAHGPDAVLDVGSAHRRSHQPANPKADESGSVSAEALRPPPR